MNLLPVVRSLRFKVSLGVILPLLVTLSLVAVLQHARHRRLEVGLLEQSASQLSRVVEVSLRDAMLTQDFGEVQRILEDLEAQAEVSDVFLFNTQGEIGFSGSRERIGTRVVMDQPGCRECHQPASVPDTFSTILTTPDGSRVLRNCNPIESEPACQACHSRDQRITGVLITDLPMDEIDRHFFADRREQILLFGFGLVAAALVVNLTVHRLVVGRLERIIAVVHAFGRGDFGQRAGNESQDEVGELAGALNRMAQGMEEKVALERELRDRSAELASLYETLQEKEARRRELLGKTINAQEEERKRLARELHDELAQALTVLIMRLEVLEEQVSPGQVALKQELARTRALTAQTLEETRQLILDLRPTMLDDLGLIPAIRWYAEMHLESLGVEVSLETSGARRRLPQTVETALFRIVQEAINNIARHAGARHVEIHLVFEDDGVTACVEDDGRGFDPVKALRGEDKPRGMGLLGMQERIDLLGGELKVDTAPGAGTRIVIKVPLGEEEASDGR